MARLSVIITTYNRHQLLPRAIRSVKECGIDAEIIVVDDASTDLTHEYCRTTNGITYIRQEKNRGTAAARNAGIKKSTSAYISFLDDDDWRLPGTFEKQLSILENNTSCGLVYGKVFYSNQQNELTGESNLLKPVHQGDVMIQLLRRNFITLSTVVIRKECFNRVGLFDSSPEMLGLEDWDMWLRLSEHYSVMAVNEPVAVYRKPEFGSGQWYSDIGRQFSKAASAYKEKWFQMPGVRAKLGNRFRATRNLILFELSDIITYGALNNSKNLKEKSARLMDAVKCRPRNLVSLRFYKAIGKALLHSK